MGVGTYEQYVERLNGMKPNVYIDGKKQGRDGDYISGGLYVIGETFKTANDPEYEELCTATSHLTGEKISRWTHTARSKDDLLKKQLMTKLLCHRVGGCIQRCMGLDTINALEVVTYDCDKANGTEYHKRFTEFLKYVQKNDLVANCA